MTVYDITVPLGEGVPVYTGDAGFRREMGDTLAGGGVSNLSVIHMSAHTATHVDAPCHMIDGAGTLDDIPPDALVGPAVVVAIEDPAAVTLAELQRHDWGGVERVLFKTANSGRLAAGEPFASDFIAIEPDAARFLVERGMRLVGLDYLSVDPPGQPDFPAHKALLGASVVVLEGVDLSGVPPGRYELFCGPLRIAGGDGAPARALLRTLP